MPVLDKSIILTISAPNDNAKSILVQCSVPISQVTAMNEELYSNIIEEYFLLKLIKYHNFKKSLKRSKYTNFPSLGSHISWALFGFVAWETSRYITVLFLKQENNLAFILEKNSNSYLHTWQLSQSNLLLFVGYVLFNSFSKTFKICLNNGRFVKYFH